MQSYGIKLYKTHSRQPYTRGGSFYTAHRLLYEPKRTFIRLFATLTQPCSLCTQQKLLLRIFSRRPFTLTRGVILVAVCYGTGLCTIFPLLSLVLTNVSLK